MLGRYLVRELAGQQDLVRGRALLEAAQQAGVTDAAHDLAVLARLQQPQAPPEPALLGRTVAAQ